MIKEGLKRAKRAQVTIFVIIGLVLVGGIILFFFFKGGVPIKTSGTSQDNPEAFLSSCMNDKIKNAINEISIVGGYPNNSLYIPFTFDGEEEKNITYLCYTQNYYAPCINQKPLFISDLKGEIKKYISQDLKDCFNKMEGSLSAGKEVSVNFKGFNVEIIPKRVVIQTDSDVTITKSGETSKYQNLRIIVSSRLYGISNMVQEIINQEAVYCYAQTQGISLLYPEFNISKLKTKYSTIYTLIDEDSKEKFRFAVRGCAIPPGLGLSQRA